MLIPVKDLAEKYNVEIYHVSQAVGKLDVSKQGEVNGKLAIMEEAIPEFFEVLKENPTIKLQFEQMESAQVKERASTFILTTTPTITTHQIIEYKGIVSAEISFGTGMLAGMAIAVSDLGGGESGALANKFALAKERAFEAICFQTDRMGCNAIVSVSTNIMVTHREMVVYSVIGTAVKVVPIQN